MHPKSRLRHDEDAKWGLYREWRILRLLPRHQHIIDCFALLHAADCFYLALELGGEQDLYSHISDQGNLLPSCDVHDVCSQIRAGVQHLHEHGCVHRDLKPENIAINAAQRVCKLLDFGLAVMPLAMPNWREGDIDSATYQHQTFTKVCGSVPFVAPEIARASPVNVYCAYRADLW